MRMDEGLFIIIIMAFRQIPHMTKSHHGGNMSLIGETPPLYIIITIITIITTITITIIIIIMRMEKWC